MQETPTGYEVPVPKRRDVLRDLRKAAKANPRKDDDSAASGTEKK